MVASLPVAGSRFGSKMADEHIINPAVDYLALQWEKLAEGGASSRHTPKEICEAIRGAYVTQPNRFGFVADCIRKQLKGRGIQSDYQKIGQKRFFVIERPK